MSTHTRKRATEFAVGLAGMLVAFTGLAASPAGQSQFLYSCTIKPKATTFESNGAFKRLTRGTVSGSTLNTGVLYQDEGTLRQRFVLGYTGGTWTMDDGSVANLWRIQVADTGACLEPDSYSSTSILASNLVFKACESNRGRWALRANGDGTYLISYDKARNYNIKLAGDPNTNGIRFVVDDVASITSPAISYRFEIRDCINMNGAGVSPAP